MTASGFRALVLRKREGGLAAAVETLAAGALPAGEVLLKAAYSSLNYKDAMAVGNRGIIRTFPAVPGIDCAGTVLASTDPKWAEGDEVILTGWGVGERVWGGLSQRVRAQGAWLVPLPKGMTPRSAMALGTAGLTAMLSVMALERHGVHPGGGEVLVTGASGGVGSVAVALLAQRGFQVVAMSGKPAEAERLLALGAVRVVGREEYATPARPGRFTLEAEAFQGAVDTIGGPTLASIIARLAYGGAVAACGLAGGTEVDTHVFPFILRGVALLGIDSVRCPALVRLEAWRRLALELPMELLDDSVRELGLEEVPAECARMLAGEARGRVVVDLGR